jgi:hypothetical protein
MQPALGQICISKLQIGTTRIGMVAQHR